MAQAARIAELDTLSALLVATSNGDRKSFARLYKLTAPRLFAVALRTLRQREEAEEVLQEAFVSVWKQASQYRPDRGQPLAWMIAIVRYRAIDLIRRHKRSPVAAATLDDVADTMAAADPRASQPGAAALTLRRCLGELNLQQQQAIKLAYYFGFTHEELATRLEAPLGTVKSWVRRGLVQLKECMQQ